MGNYIPKLDQEVDAYGLPKLTNKVPKRSVSLIRWASPQMRIDDNDKFQGFPGCQKGYATEEWQRGDSVSLTIRNYFQLCLLTIDLAQVQQRSIRKETRSTRREEFKAKFESASVKSLHVHSSLYTNQSIYIMKSCMMHNSFKDIIICCYLTFYREA